MQQAIRTARNAKPISPVAAQSRPQGRDIQAGEPDRAEQSPARMPDRRPRAGQRIGHRAGRWSPLAAATAEKDNERGAGKHLDGYQDGYAGVIQIKGAVGDPGEQQRAGDAVGEKPDSDEQAQQRPAATEELPHANTVAAHDYTGCRY